MSEQPLRALTWYQHIFVTFFILMGKFVQIFLTRTTIEGKDKIPENGPLIIASNHASTYDAVIMRTLLPRKAFFVGPGDFKLELGGTWMLANSGVIFAKRGSVDRAALKKMESVLRSGGMLAIFPEGGTWEKRIEDVKSGAAYLSMLANAPILPIALGGTYRVWYDIMHLRRPHIQIRFGDVIPPVEVSGNRKTRQDELQQASVDLMWKIYEMLPPEDQQRYDEMERQVFDGAVEVQNGPHAEAFDTLAEFLLKPNLLRPFIDNTPAPLDPLTTKLGQMVSPADMATAASAFQTMLSGPFQGYLEYRLGEEKAQQVYQQLDELITITQNARGQQGIRMIANMTLTDPVNVLPDGATADA